MSDYKYIKDMREMSIGHLEGDNFMTWSTSERKWINRIKKLADIYPNDVVITYVNQDGSLNAKLPYSWFKAPAPRKKVAPMSDERRAAAAERLAQARKMKKSNETS